MRSPENCCVRCVHWGRYPMPGENVPDGFENIALAKMYGQCRRRAPTLHVYQNGSHPFPETEWPNTSHQQWCGEFSPKSEDEP